MKRTGRGIFVDAIAAEATTARAATKKAPAAKALSASEQAERKLSSLRHLHVEFVFERETKGAVRYQETKDGAPVEIGNGAIIGALYIRKDALNGVMPRKLVVSVSFDASDVA
jgi:hypothetical protein